MAVPLDIGITQSPSHLYVLYPTVSISTEGGTTGKVNSKFVDSNDRTINTWRDPAGQFELQYPSNWTAIGKANRFEDAELTLIGRANGSVSVVVIDLKERYEISDSPGTRSLHETCESIKNTTSPLIMRYDIEESLNYSKYSIDKHKACSQLISYVPIDKNYTGVGLLVISLINGTQIDIAYTTTSENYDRGVSIVNRIINSTRIY
jgi:hypothetical protein